MYSTMQLMVFLPRSWSYEVVPAERLQRELPEFLQRPAAAGRNHMTRVTKFMLGAEEREVLKFLWRGWRVIGPEDAWSLKRSEALP